ncbi:MAG: tol-pal system protein YbgF [Pseudomonas fluorescens]|nr:MAG: tol-pal system protein YbgF [Pseudomonas fluorescens]
MPKLRLLPALLITVSSLTLVNQSWGQAVSVDATSLIRRLDAMEARLDKTESRRSASAGSPNIGGMSSYSAADLEQRMTGIEEETSQLRGNSDRAIQAIERLAKRFDDYIKDMDMRMSDLEARVDSLTDKASAAPAAATPAEATTPVTGTPVTTSTAPAEATTTPAAVKPAAGIPADMSAADHYNKAYAYLTATDYKNAQIWFEEFLKRHSSDSLADNAYYWLGEVYLVQNNPSQAVTKFRDGLKAFPKGNKAPANLFKMGVALEQLKQPKLARAAWEKLVKDYPSAPETTRAKDKLLQVKA